MYTMVTCFRHMGPHFFNFWIKLSAPMYKCIRADCRGRRLHTMPSAPASLPASASSTSSGCGSCGFGCFFSTFLAVSTSSTSSGCGSCGFCCFFSKDVLARAHDVVSPTTDADERDYDEYNRTARIKRMEQAARGRHN